MLALFLALGVAPEPSWISIKGGPRSVSRSGDVNGDGVPDFAVGDPGGSVGAEPAVGSPTIIYSGKDGTLLLRIAPPAGAKGFGRSIALLDDFDDDGLRDLAISACAHYEPSSVEPKNSWKAGVYVVSSKSGSVLRSKEGPDADPFFGFELASAGDLDGDGRRELLAGSPGSGAVHIYSGKDMSLLRTVRGEKGEIGFGSSVGAGGDINQDSTEDVIIGVLGATSPTGRGAVVISGKDGRLLMSIAREECGSTQPCRFGVSVALTGDVDGDRRPDLLLGADHAAHECGVLFLYSGRDGRRIDSMTGTYVWARFGASVAAIGDVDGDGIPDFAASDTADAEVEHGGELQAAGSVHAFSGKTRTRLWVSRGSTAFGALGYCIAPFDDLDRDGVPDVLAKESKPGGAVAWGCKVLSGKTGKVLLDVPRSENTPK